MSSIAFDFEDEVVIVTGGSSGIGREIVLGFARAGATVLSADIRESPRESHNELPTHEAASDLPGDVTFVETDVSDPDDVRGVVDEAREFGGVDVMVNNAGIHIPQSILDVTAEEFDTVMDINARGVLLGCKYAAADMLDRDASGAIVNTASINSSHAMREQVAYCASKGAVQMITYAAALDLADTGIRVNAVAPGVIETEVARPIEEVRESASEGGFIKEIPQGRSGLPEEIANGTLYLASDAAGYVTGELLYIDGGWHTF
ncbi:SDR family NAD(P)-dependent oxidoreductase [Natronobeatus ordinarius]|uniref:SDR family NAD(P)-dependent oxidoreductase n=1 Tax=Natronobeatus ordinarius TaxID=2963433 RepID=UPI0020CBE408|nr:SDR family oxidoreductase [Natronobeatus ordinarius]